jgi:hypothetical protein
MKAGARERGIVGLRGAVALVLLVQGAACSKSTGEVGETTESARVGGSRHTLTIVTPPSIPWPDVTLDATEGVKLEHQADVDSVGPDPKAAPPARILNMSSGLVELEERSSADEIWSRSPVRVEAGARVSGVVHASSVFVDPRAFVGGRDSAPMLDPPLVTQVVVEFPPSHAAPTLTVDKRRSRDLAPGRFANVDVRGGGSLTLHSGAYYLERLSVADGATVVLAASNGPVHVYVRNKLEWLGKTSGTPRSDLALVFVGTTTVKLEAPFRGAVLAPAAPLELQGSSWHGHHDDGFGHGRDLRHDDGRFGHHDDHRFGGHDRFNFRSGGHHHGEGPEFRGAFFAKSVHVGKSVTVKYDPPNALVPVVAPPTGDIQKCADAVRPRLDLHGTARDQAFQADIARLCSMNGGDDCTATLVGRANADFTAAALRLVAGQLTPAEYLRLVRDREKKLADAEHSPARAAALCRGDGDGDGVPQGDDDCPNTPDLTATNDQGCTDNVLPEAPAPGDVKRIFDKGGFMFSAACSGAQMVPTQPIALILTGPELYLSTTRLTNLPPGCAVWYFFEIDSGTRQFQVAFKDTEAVSALLGRPTPVPPGVIQFRINAADTGTRADVLRDAQDPSAVGRRPFRVRAMNGGGMRSNWSQWVHSDCRPLGLACGTGS